MFKPGWHINDPPKDLELCLLALDVLHVLIRSHGNRDGQTVCSMIVAEVHRTIQSRNASPRPQPDFDIRDLVGVLVAARNFHHVVLSAKSNLRSVSRLGQEVVFSSISAAELLIQHHVLNQSAEYIGNSMKFCLKNDCILLSILVLEDVCACLHNGFP